METNIDEILVAMVNILERKAERMKMLLTLTKAQGELFSVDTLDRLNNNLRQKQECIDDINRLDKSFEGYYEEFTRSKDQIQEICKHSEKTASLMKRMQEDTAQIQDYINQMREIESENHKKAEKLMEDIKSNLQLIGKEKKAVNVYGNKRVHGSVFDRKK